MKKTNYKNSAKIHVLAKSTCNLIVGKESQHHPKWRDVYNRIKDKLNKAKRLPTPQKYGRIRVAKEYWVCDPKDFYIYLKKSFQLAPNTSWDDVKDAITNQSYTLNETFNQTNVVDCGTLKVEINLTEAINDFEKQFLNIGKQLNEAKVNANKFCCLLPGKAKKVYAKSVRKIRDDLVINLNKSLPE